MGTSLASPQAVGLPTPIAPDLDREAGIAFNAVLEQFGSLTIPRNRMPSPELRERIEVRCAKLREWLGPAPSVKALYADIGAVLSTMATRGGSTGDAKTVIQIYAADLADLPAWAVTAACRDHRQGRAGDGRWAPTQAEIRRTAEGHMVRLTAELRKLDKILNATPEPELAPLERRKQVAASVKEAVAAARRKAANDLGLKRAETPAEVIARFEAEADKPIAPLSPDLAARFRGPDFSDEEIRNG